MSSTPPPHPDLALALEASDGGARATTFMTAHGPVRTPTFMPVATKGSLKGITHAQLERLAPDVMLANTYHLHLRPGEATVRDLGGLHGFTGWQGPWITDSGGYQVFSLDHRATLDEEGVTLRSHLDGAPVRLGPREAMAIQESLGADLIMAFDHCLALPASREALEAAVHRTTRWTAACAAARTRSDQALFGIVQGGTDPALRALSAEALLALDLPGYAIGGLAVGEGGQAMRAAVEATTPLLPAAKPRYLMGVGQPLDLIDAIAAGVDMFDCVLPTRNGRRGWLWTRDGTVRIGARLHAKDDAPLDAECRCEVCRTHSRGYLRHLFKTGEHTAVTLGSLHNLTFLFELVRGARTAILAGTYTAFAAAFRARFEAGERAWQEAHARDPEAAFRSREANRARGTGHSEAEPA
ncbi:MAG: tRNA guanosine(34) transglycosylase Tgt [Planctomycetota bacterium]|nr:tRNA guanosine(34) transglycosylase Tgt [Planctomycetota bacterium]